MRKYFTALFFILIVMFFVSGCGSTKTDIAKLTGETWVKLDQDAQTSAVEELIKSEGEKGKEHTVKYYIRQLNSYFGNPGTSSQSVKNIFHELAVSNKTAEQLVVVDGHAWKKMSRAQQMEILKDEIRDIAEKNPAFKPKSTDEYYRELNEIYDSADERFLNQPVSSTIKKVLTNNLIIDGKLVK